MILRLSTLRYKIIWYSQEMAILKEREFEKFDLASRLSSGLVVCKVYCCLGYADLLLGRGETVASYLIFQVCLECERHVYSVIKRKSIQ